MVHFKAGELVDCVHGAADAGFSHGLVDHHAAAGGIDLVGFFILAFGNIHQQVPGKTDDADALVVLGDVHHHHDVRLAIALGIVRCAVLGVFAVAGVRAKDQDLHPPGGVAHLLVVAAAGVQRSPGDVVLKAQEPETGEGDPANHGHGDYGGDDLQPHRHAAQGPKVASGSEGAVLRMP